MPRWFGNHFGLGFVLFVHDVVVFYAIIELVHYFRLGYRIDDLTPVTIGVIASIIGISTLGLYLADLYHVDRRVKPYEMAARTFVALAVTGSIIAAILYVTRLTDHFSVLYRGNLVASLSTFALWSVVVRYMLQHAVLKYGREFRWLVIGDGRLGQLLAQDHSTDNLAGRLVFLPVAERDLDALALSRESSNVLVKCGERTLYDGAISGVIIATDDPLPGSLVRDLMAIRLKGVPIIESTDYYERELLRVPVLQLGEHWFAMSEGFDLVHGGLSLKVKRSLDLATAVFGLLLSFPVMILVALAVRVSSAGPVLYTQRRCGYGGEPFTLYKFRTMVRDAEKNGAQWTVPGDPRITLVGKWLRKTRLDELPQLWNVLKGDMSLVGPRPERPDFVKMLEKQIPYYDMRHLVKPGLTGWAQVKYPYGASIEDARKKLDYDLYYIKHHSLYFDLYIVLRTLRVVVSRAGV